MNEIDDYLKEMGIKPLGYEKHKSTILIKTKDNKYVIKKKEKPLENIYDYLESRSFSFFPHNHFNMNEKYNISEYVQDKNLSDYDRSTEIVNLVSLLHNKTTSYEEVDLDDYKKIYEDLVEKNSSLVAYFNELNDVIDAEIYMSPSSYLLVRNISKIYASLDFCRKELDDFIKLVEDNPKQRKVLNHNNLSLDHLLRNEDSFLISWDKASFGIPIYDIYNLYLNTYDKVEFSTLLQMYENKYPLHQEERKLLFALMAMPYNIKFINNEYENTLRVQKLLKYLNITEKIILPYYSNQQDEENHNFQEQ